jgi:hypothetical protein
MLQFAAVKGAITNKFAFIALTVTFADSLHTVLLCKGQSWGVRKEVLPSNSYIFKHVRKIAESDC